MKSGKQENLARAKSAQYVVVSLPAVCGNMIIKNKVIGYMVAELLWELIRLEEIEERKHEKTP